MSVRTSALRWVVGALGLAAIAWGGRLVLVGGIATDPVGVGTWLVVGLVAHDAVVAPLVVGLGLLGARTVPGWLRAPLQVLLLVAGVLTLASGALLFGPVFGPDRSEQNPSVDMLDYPRNLAAVLAVAVVATASWALVRRRHAAQLRSSDRNTRPPVSQRSSST